jgi:hypothetical protein
MDLQHLFRALWRFRLVIAMGTLLAIAIAGLSYMRVDFSDGRPTFTYRQQEQWQSSATIFLTSKGFPWGAVVDPGVIREQGQEAIDPADIVDAERLTYLADLYRELASSDAVFRILAEDGPVEGALVPQTVLSSDESSPLPMVNLAAVAASREEAVALATRYMGAFRTFLEQRQTNSGIPEEKRVVAEVVREPSGAELIQARKKTRPIFLFLAVMVVTCGIVLVLENLRPRIRPVPADSSSHEASAVATRRSA